MQQTWKMRLLLALATLGLAFYFLYPSMVYFSLNEEELKDVREKRDAFQKYVPSFMPKSHIVPGLDLQGGIHIVLGVDLEKAISDKTSRAADRLVSLSKDEGINIVSFEQFGDSVNLKDRVKIDFGNDTDLNLFKEKVLKRDPDFALLNTGTNNLSLRINEEMVHSIKSDAVNQTVKTIINRIDKIGVTEPSVSRRGADQIQIQLAGYNDPEQAKNLLGRTAQLQFQMCDDETDFLKKLTDLPEGVKLVDHGKDLHLEFNEEKLDKVKEYIANKTLPENVIRFGKAYAQGPLGHKMMRTYTLKRRVELTGDDLVDARVTPGSDNNPRPGVSLSLGPQGAKIFADITAQNIGKRMAIVLEDMVDSAPVINSKIPDGHAFISMGGAKTNQEIMQDANQLALVLKAGALPAPVTFREERQVGPSLGKDSIDQAKIAFLVGTIIIATFMIFYYRMAGFFSIIGLIFNMTFILASMSLLGATLSLPGVAALLLTMGVAVDSNVIINERIREELRLGKLPRSAVRAGYEAALSAIVDANVTTCIAGIVLWQFGTGPVQNFATMLLLGTVSSVITAIFITRIFLDMRTSAGQKTLSI